MKYDNFMKITDKWSDGDIVSFLMESPLWNEMIMRFIMHKWRNDFPIELEEIAFYAQDNNILEYTNLPEEDE
jgi:hypothetical protein